MIIIIFFISVKHNIVTISPSVMFVSLREDDFPPTGGLGVIETYVVIVVDLYRGGAKTKTIASILVQLRLQPQRHVC
jgi:hypothetical protein